MKEPIDKQKENERYQSEMISMILNNDDIYIKSIDIIRPEMFTGINRTIFDTYVKMINDCVHPDPVSISTRSNIPVESVLNIYTQYSGVSLKLDSLLFELFDFMAKDKLIKLGASISQQVTAGTNYEDIVRIVNSTLRGLELGNSSQVITMQDGVNRMFEIIQNNRKENSFTGTPVGFKIVDKVMGGLQATDLIILAGETSHGKTSLALSMMYNSATMYGERCGIISHEMSPEQIMSRLTSYATNLSAKLLLTGKLSDEQLAIFTKDISKILTANIFIQDFIRRELTDTIAAVRLMVMQHHIKFVVIENAGNINVKGTHGNEERTAEISKQCKSIAMELKITVILISHLNRDDGQGVKKQPELTRLRHSGQLEQDADVVLFVYRPELHGFEHFQGTDEKDIPSRGRAKVYIAKGRNYGLSKSYPEFIEEQTFFKDFEEPVSVSLNFHNSRSWE